MPNLSVLIEQTTNLNASQNLLLQQSQLGRELLEIFSQQKLQCVFQPIIDLQRKKICAFEGLVRGPLTSPLYHPLNLFGVAEEHNVLYELDNFARVSTIAEFAKQALDDEPLHLFLNISVNAVLNSAHQKGVTLEALKYFGLSPERVVIEITELQPIEDFELFIEAINYYRSIGFKVAIDDLGSGYNGLRVWSEVRPDFVKIDRHFVNDIHLDNDKRIFMQTLLTLAKGMGTRVVAEGVESESELEVLTELGVDLVQGYLFKKPEMEINHQLLYQWPQTPVNKVVLQSNETVEGLALEYPSVSSEQLLHAVSEQFLQRPDTDCFPVVDKGVVQGMIWRRDLMDLLARKFGQELHGRKTVAKIMDKKPIVVDAGSSLVELSRLVTDGQHHFTKDAFIIEKNGHYLGCGNFRDLLRQITDLKVQSAQHANPLSGLPGNVPIQKQLKRWIGLQQAFFVMYIDVDNFKPFNDYYSFEQGDNVISLIADIINKTVPQNQITGGQSFVGHIGGDDFVVMGLDIGHYQHWATRILRCFEQRILDFYHLQDQQRGGIEGSGRDGVKQLFPIMTLSIGIVELSAGQVQHAQQVASMATKAKKYAKRIQGNSLYLYEKSMTGTADAGGLGEQLA